MKTSFHWFLISTSLALPLSFNFSASAAVVTTDLDSQQSFKGPGTFSPMTLDNADGNILNLIADVSITDAGDPTELTKSCFGQTAGDLTFVGNGHSLSFYNITAPSVAGAAIGVSATTGKTLKLSGFSDLFFVLSPKTGGQGAVNSKGAALFQGNKKVVFASNATTENGGALNATSITFTGNTDLSFSKNSATTTTTTTTSGGALYTTGEVKVGDSLGAVTFSGNTAAQGGAIYCEGNGFITNNYVVNFEGNKATGTTGATPPAGNGGAIYCSKTAATPPTPSPILTISGNKYLTFSGNSATSNGGAIYTNQLVLSAQGPTLFKDNTATNTTAAKGGAIAIAASGKLSLSADAGDITFSGNKTVTGTTGSETTTRNAIDMGDGALIAKLRASAGNSIFFYDPITATATATTTTSTFLSINSSDSTWNPPYQGSIVFSGEQLSAAEAAQEANLKSTIKQPVALVGGSLVLKSGAILVTGSFDQVETASLIMDTGTKLESEANLNITNLIINVDSLDTTKKAVLKAPAANNITLSGSLTLADASGNAYESLTFDQDRVFSFLQLETNPTQINLVDLIPTPSAPGDHYGYQGEWSVAWTETTSAKTATLTWEKTGYIPNPERVTSLVPNTLWGSCVDIRAFQQVVETCFHGDQGPWGLWGAGLANFLHRDPSNTSREYHHTSSGYVVGAYKSLSPKDVISIAFCELYGNDRDRFLSKSYSTIYAGSLYFQHVGHSLNRGNSFIFEAQCNYSYTNNDMTTRYTFAPEVSSCWSNDCLAAELCGTMPFYFSRGSRGFYSIAPSFKAEAIYAHQKEFKELGDEARSFESSDLINVALPVGMTFESKMNRAIFNTTFVYAADVYRKDPHNTTTLIINNASWETFGTNLSRQAVIARAGIHLDVTSNFEMFSKFAFELRGSSRSYHVDLGSKVLF